MNNLRTAFRWESGGETIAFGGPADGFILNWPDGADSVMASVQSIESESAIGSIAQKIAIQPRPITLDGYILRDKDANTDRLQAAFSPLREGTLVATMYDGSIWEAQCYVTQTPDIEPAWNKPHFQIMLTAMYPLWVARASSVRALTAGQNSVTIRSGGPAAFSVQTTAAAGGSFVLRDGENVLRYDGPISAGQRLEIHVDVFGRVSASLDGADVIGRVTGALTALQPGKLTIQASAACTLTWKAVRAGV